MPLRLYPISEAIQTLSALSRLVANLCVHMPARAHAHAHTPTHTHQALVVADEKAARHLAAEGAPLGDAFNPRVDGLWALDLEEGEAERGEGGRRKD